MEGDRVDFFPAAQGQGGVDVDLDPGHQIGGFSECEEGIPHYKVGRPVYFVRPIHVWRRVNASPNCVPVAKRVEEVNLIDKAIPEVFTDRDSVGVHGDGEAKRQILERPVHRQGRPSESVFSVEENIGGSERLFRGIDERTGVAVVPRVLGRRGAAAQHGAGVLIYLRGESGGGSQDEQSREKTGSSENA